MNWHSWQAFVAMGGYGLYVWGSFGMVLLALVLEWLAIARHRRRALRQVQQALSTGAAEVTP